ncbi:MAG: hypothetical protein ACRDU8_00940, partial [Egibacteraceae bacterium]
MATEARDATGARIPDVTCRVETVQPALTVFARAIGGDGTAADPRAPGADLPPRVDRFPSYAENRSWYSVAFAHRAMHQAAGSCALDWRQPPRCFPPLVESLPTPAGATDLWGFFGLFADRRLAVDLFTVLEDLRVEEALRRQLPGLRDAVDRVRRSALDERGPLPPTAPSALLEVAVRLSLGTWDLA